MQETLRNPQPYENTILTEIEKENIYKESDSDKEKIVKSLKVLRDPEKFIDQAPKVRQEVGDKPSKVTVTFFLAVKDLLLLAVAHNIVSKPKSERLLKFVSEIDNMLLERQKISRIKKPDGERTPPPESLKESFNNALKNAITKHAGQQGVTQNEIINSVISSLNPELREGFLLFIAGELDESRIPVAGPMPDDIREFNESQIDDINEIIDSSLELLVDDKPNLVQ